jgi:ABC-type multidrug transport system fused ATPase/permease subunit
MSDMPPPPPPSYAYPIPADEQVQRFRPIGKVARALVVLQIILAAATALSIVAIIGVRNWGDRYLSGTIDEDEFIRKITPFVGATFLVATVSIAAFVLLCIWSYRMAANLPLLGRVDRRWGPGWGIAGWILTAIFAVVAIIPYMMHAELWRGSDPQTPPSSTTWKTNPVEPLLHVWLALSLASAVSRLWGGFDTSFDVGRSSETIAEELRDRLAMNILSLSLALAAAVVFIVFIRRLTQRHMAATGER